MAFSLADRKAIFDRVLRFASNAIPAPTPMVRSCNYKRTASASRMLDVLPLALRINGYFTLTLSGQALRPLGGGIRLPLRVMKGLNITIRPSLFLSVIFFIVFLFSVSCLISNRIGQPLGWLAVLSISTCLYIAEQSAAIRQLNYLVSAQ